jgi:hypothetical protein
VGFEEAAALNKTLVAVAALRLLGFGEIKSLYSMLGTLLVDPSKQELEASFLETRIG